MKRVSGLAVVVAVVGSLALGCGRSADTAQPVSAGKPAREFAEGLRQRVTTDAMVEHLGELQAIADRHDGTRAVGTPGYDASVDYVAGVLRLKLADCTSS